MSTAFYSIYTGLCYQLNDIDICLLDDGQLPLKQLVIQNCKKCFNKRYTGFNTKNFTYTPCKCVVKNIDSHKVKQKFNIQNTGV